MKKAGRGRKSLFLKLIPVTGILAIIIVSLVGAGAYFRNDGSGYFLNDEQQQQVQTQYASSSSVPDLLPKSPPPQNSFYVVKPDGSFQFTVAALEGLVARSSPQIFLETGGDAFWLNYTATNYHMNYQIVSPTSLLQQFKSEVTDSSGKVKIIVFDSNDPIAPAQEDMAMTLAGIYGALPVATDDLSSMQNIFGANNLNTLYDLRTVNGGNEFTDKLSAYTWLWDNFGSKTSNQLIGLNPGSYTLSDYLVEFKAFVFEFGDTSAMSQSESNFATSVISSYPENTPALGFFELGGEVNTITLLSPYQILMVPSSSVADLSFYSGLPTISLKQVAPQSITYNPSKTYVMFSFTQGNALAFDFYSNLNDWQSIDPATGQPYREEIPSTFQTSPFLAELAPPIISYWYSSMYSDDSFMSGGSAGAGYDYPDQLPDLSSWLSIASALDSNADLNNLFVLLNSGKDTTATCQTIINSIPATSAMFLRQNLGGLPYTISGVPAFSATMDANSKDGVTVNQVVSGIENASQGGNHFVYIFLTAQNPGYPFIEQVSQALGTGYVLVSAAQLTNLYMQSIGATSTTSSSSTSTTTSSRSTTTTTTSTTASSSTSSSTTSSSTTTKDTSSSSRSSTTTTTSISSTTTTASSSTGSTSSSTTTSSTTKSSSSSTTISETTTTRSSSSTSASSSGLGSSSSSSTTVVSSSTTLATSSDSSSLRKSQSSSESKSITSSVSSTSTQAGTSLRSTNSSAESAGALAGVTSVATHDSFFAYWTVLLAGLPVVVGLTLRGTKYH